MPRVTLDLSDAAAALLLNPEPPVGFQAVHEIGAVPTEARELCTYGALVRAANCWEEFFSLTDLGREYQRQLREQQEGTKNLSALFDGVFAGGQQALRTETIGGSDGTLYEVRAATGPDELVACIEGRYVVNSARDTAGPDVLQFTSIEDAEVEVGKRETDTLKWRVVEVDQ